MDLTITIRLRPGCGSRWPNCDTRRFSFSLPLTAPSTTIAGISSQQGEMWIRRSFFELWIKGPKRKAPAPQPICNRTMCFVLLGSGERPSGQTISLSARRIRKCLRLAYSLAISTIHHVGSRDRRNDLIGGHDRARVVRNIDVEG